MSVPSREWQLIARPVGEPGPTDFRLLRTEVSDPASHNKKNMPFLLAGGGLRTGRWVKYGEDPPHNNLLVSLLNLFGDPSTTFGDARCCTGALPNLV